MYTRTPWWCRSILCFQLSTCSESQLELKGWVVISALQAWKLRWAQISHLDYNLHSGWLETEWNLAGTHSSSRRLFKCEIICCKTDSYLQSEDPLNTQTPVSAWLMLQICSQTVLAYHAQKCIPEWRDPGTEVVVGGRGSTAELQTLHFLPSWSLESAPHKCCERSVTYRSREAFEDQGWCGLLRHTIHRQIISE